MVETDTKAEVEEESLRGMGNRNERKQRTNLKPSCRPKALLKHLQQPEDLTTQVLKLEAQQQH